jgi:hypothetical protein
MNFNTIEPHLLFHYKTTRLCIIFFFFSKTHEEKQLTVSDRNYFIFGLDTSSHRLLCQLQRTMDMELVMLFTVSGYINYTCSCLCRLQIDTALPTVYPWNTDEVE